MKNSNYFPHDYDSSTDKKVVRLRAKFGWSGYGIYWATIEALAREDGYMDRGVIGVAIGDPTAEEVIDYCLEIKLLKKRKAEIYSERLLEHLEIRQKYIKAGKKGAEKRWNSPSSSDSPPISPPIRQSDAKKSKVKKSKVNNTFLKDYNHWLKAFNTERKTKYKTKALYKNFAVLREMYTQEEMVAAHKRPRVVI